MGTKIGVALAMGAIVAGLGCGKADDGCTKDSDCKGERVCQAGTCADPWKPSASVPVATLQEPPTVAMDPAPPAPVPVKAKSKPKAISGPACDPPCKATEQCVLRRAMMATFVPVCVGLPPPDKCSTKNKASCPDGLRCCHGMKNACMNGVCEDEPRECHDGEECAD